MHLKVIDLTESDTNETDFNNFFIRSATNSILIMLNYILDFFLNENNEFLCLAFQILNNTTNLHDAF